MTGRVAHEEGQQVLTRALLALDSRDLATRQLELVETVLAKEAIVSEQFESNGLVWLEA